MRTRAFLFLLLLISGPALAGDAITVAVASNFSRAAAEISAKFAGETGITVRISNGSTGKLYAQILNGAPFDVFLAADAERPVLLEQSGHAVAGSRTTYAEGTLVLWSGVENDCLAALRDEHGGRVALANPATAPYGKAAVNVLDHYNLFEKVEKKLVVYNSGRIEKLTTFLPYHYMLFFRIEHNYVSLLMHVSFRLVFYSLYYFLKIFIG